jgi:acetolactate decarboxylase
MHGAGIGNMAWGKWGVARKAALVAVGLMAVTSVALAVTPQKEGAVEYIGSQKDIVASGKTGSIINLQELAGTKNLFAMGPVAGLDGEITIFNSQPYVSQVRGDDYEVHHSLDYGAIFLVWSAQAEWRDIAIPETVKSYLDLQDFVKQQAQDAGLDTGQTFAFLLSGTPTEIKYHINIDRTGGQPITQELFLKSKAPFICRNEAVDILGFYAENHPGVFITKTSPAIKADSGRQNAMHIHLISKTSKATGHIDDLTLGAGMILRLPKS